MVYVIDVYFFTLFDREAKTTPYVVIFMKNTVWFLFILCINNIIPVICVNLFTERRYSVE